MNNDKETKGEFTMKINDRSWRLDKKIPLRKLVVKKSTSWSVILLHATQVMPPLPLSKTSASV